MMAKNFPEFIKDMNCQIQESLEDPSRKSQNNSRSKHIVVKLWSTINTKHIKTKRSYQGEVKKQITTEELQKTDSKILNNSFKKWNNTVSELRGNNCLS